MEVIDYKTWRYNIISENQNIVSACDNCNADAQSDCEECNGDGEAYCDCCHNDNPCKECDETGRTDCPECDEKIKFSEKHYVKQVRKDFFKLSGKCDSCTRSERYMCVVCAKNDGKYFQQKKEE